METKEELEQRLSEQRAELKKAFDALDPETREEVKRALKKTFDELKDPNSQAHKGIVAGTQAIYTLHTAAKLDALMKAPTTREQELELALWGLWNIYETDRDIYMDEADNKLTFDAQELKKAWLRVKKVLLRI